MNPIVAVPILEGKVIETNMTTVERKTFVTKVFTCVQFQLLTLMYFIFSFKYYNLEYFFYTDYGRGLLGLSLFTSLFAMFSTSCCYDIFKSFPMNYILLVLFSCSSSYLVTNSIAFVDSNTLALATGITCIDVFGILLISLFADISSYYNYLYISLISLVSLSLINLFIFSTFLQMIICGFGSTLFSCLLLYDINQVTSSDNKIYFKEDFIIASINIYLDILNIFLYILQCLELGETAN